MLIVSYAEDVMVGQIGHVWPSLLVIAHTVVADLEDIEAFESEEGEHDEVE